MGLAYSALWNQSWPSKPTWTPDEIPDLTDKVVLVTGGNSGVGKEMVRVLLLHNATVYLAARSSTSAQSVISELEQSTGKTSHFLHLDLSDLSSVRAAAAEFLSREKRLDVLFNNAGVFLAPRDKLTPQGYDMTVGTNVLGPFLFTQLLLPILSSPTSKGRVISTSSVTHYFAPHFDFAVARPGAARDKLGRDMLGNDVLYAQTKTAETVLARERARRYGDAIVSIAINPGNILTNMQRNMKGLNAAMVKGILYPVELGAYTGLRAGTTPEAADWNGKYLRPWAQLGHAHPATQDPETGRKVWEWAEEQCKEWLEPIDVSGNAVVV
ncbi:NAD(P)-binding protein [Peniophora sp. CONT]|nr:NAD(P)-binding protein [Peniophora sp. CONT]